MKVLSDKEQEQLDNLLRNAHLPEQNAKAIKSLEEKVSKGILGMHKLMLSTVLAMIVLPATAMYFVVDGANNKVVNSTSKLTEQIRVSDSIKTEIITQYRIDNAILKKKLSNGGS